MDQTRFEAIVSAYGADPARWPPAEREAARAYAEAHPDIAAPVLAREGELDALLSTVSAPRPEPVLEKRLMASLPAQAAPPRWIAMAAGIALVAGLSLGFAGSALLGPQGWEEQTFYTAAFDTLEAETGWTLEETE